MITILAPEVVNQIAAGEVVERPASVLKELLENSIDAGSTDIKVYIKEFGTQKIQVVDNGSGIEKSDLDRVFLKHATSKISKGEDLDAIITFGFRGEALASISSVSRVSLQTKHQSDEVGSEVLFDQGAIQSIRPSARTTGTDIQILDLFGNVPARKKFLKARITENKALLDIFHKFVLANPAISFHIDIDGTAKSYPVEDGLSRAARILKIEKDQLVPVFYDGGVKVSGYVIHPKTFLKSRSSQFVFVNKRPVNDNTIYKAIVDGYDTFLMKHQIPGYVLFVDVLPNLVDVNVHPRKTEVRFANPSEIYKSVRTGVNVNLVKFLREETKKKLNMRPEGSFIAPTLSPATSIINEPSSDTFKTEDTQTKSSHVQEFESFLTSSKSTNSQEVIPTGRQNPEKVTTAHALLFNHEVLAESENESNGLYLDFANATQLLDSYIVTSNGKDLLIIDQHAASERYFYEKYLTQLKKKKVESKLLLFPEVIELDELELKLIQDSQTLFNDLGFAFELFGDNELKFTQVPDFVKMDNFPKLIHTVVQDLLEFGEISNIKDKIYHEIAAILACHTAVRFGDKVTREEIIRILKNLSICEDPYNCPHGRPIIQEFSKYEIEKKFKRCGM